MKKEFILNAAEVWKIEAFADRLKRGIENPGVLIVGPDFSAKDLVQKLFVEWQQDSTREITMLYPVVILDGNRSCDHDERHRAVMELMNGGVKNVIVVYLYKDAERCADHILNGSLYRQALALLENPPTEDGIYCLASVKVEY